MRSVPAACLMLLLAVGAVIAQDCVKTFRRPGAKNPDDSNVDCVMNGNCDDDVDNSCECVPYYLCRRDDNIRGRKRLVITSGDNENQCVDPLEVCCAKPSQIIRGAGGSKASGTTPLPYPATPRLGCGQRNKGGVGFRITGNVEGEAQFGEFPWMVALLEIDNGDEKFVGGGSLIHPQIVLTAAHSVIRFTKDPSNLRIRAGEWDTQSEAEVISHQQREVTQVIIHEKFFLGGLHNDIALLVLRDEVDQADNVGLLCLPEQGVTSNSSKCIAPGWGSDTFSDGKSNCFQVILKSILLPMVQRNQCETMLRKTKLGGKFRLHNSFTYAGGKGGKDACKGYGGGPLACPIPGDEEFYEQGGIVAWSVGCGDVGVPGVYTDVAQFRNWVDQKFDELRFGTESYQRPNYK